MQGETSVNSYTVHVEDNPPEEDMDVVEEGLQAYIVARSPLVDLQPLAVLLRDENHQVVGGALGWTKRGWLEINEVWVHEHLRGQSYGTQLIQAAEQEAFARGCRQVYLSTLSFEAPEFYRKLGYEEIGRLEGYKDTRYHFQKRLH
jgi:ribosomal protein S18 acetylase RimI-like enzyme